MYYTDLLYSSNKGLSHLIIINFINDCHITPNNMYNLIYAWGLYALYEDGDDLE